MYYYFFLLRKNSNVFKSKIFYISEKIKFRESKVFSSANANLQRKFLANYIKNSVPFAMKALSSSSAMNELIVCSSSRCDFFVHTIVLRVQKLIVSLNVL